MAWRDEGRKVVQAVAVETPDKRPDDLPDRREPDDRERLEPDGSRLEDEERCENECREDAESNAHRARRAVGREHSDDGRTTVTSVKWKAARHRIRRKQRRRFDRGLGGTPMRR